MYLICLLLLSSLSFAQPNPLSTAPDMPMGTLLVWAGLVVMLCSCLFLCHRTRTLQRRQEKQIERWKRLPFMVTELNVSGDILAMDSMLDNGMTTVQQVGQSWFDHIRETDQNVFKRALADAFRLGLSQECEAQWRDLKGVRYFLHKIVPLPIQGNQPRAMVISLDISDRKDAENILLQGRTQAEQIATDTSQFLANMTHEIRTPLNGILGLIELIEEAEQLAQVKELLPPLISSTQHLNRLVDDVLELAKSGSGLLTLEEIRVSVWQILDDLEALYQPQARQKQLAFTVYIDPAVPRMLMVDAFRLRQVLYNLMSNAIKFTEQGGICVKVERMMVGRQALLKFTVQDTGIGIDEAIQGQIFDAYRQAHSSTQRKYGGTGLGLSICKNLVSVMGGVIGVNSEAQKGAEFWFTINLQPATDTQQLHNLQQQSVYLAIQNSHRLEWFLQFFNLLQVAVVIIDSADEMAKQKVDLLITDHLSDIQTERCWWLSGEFNDRYTVVSEPYRREGLFLMLLNYEQEGSPVMQTSTSSTAKVCHLLLVEDNLTNQLVVRKTLEKIGYQITIANNGQEGVDAFTEQAFNGVIMDIQMPVMDGIEATRQIRQIPGPYVPIIALTANGQKEIEEACFAVGMDAYLNKPLDRLELQSTLERLLGSNVTLQKGSDGMQ